MWALGSGVAAAMAAYLLLYGDDEPGWGNGGRASALARALRASPALRRLKGRELAARVAAPSLAKFVAAVREALAFGAPLAATLERQADAIREDQRASVERRIEEVPVRMLIPLGALVVPAMLLAILGPLLSAALSR